MRAANDNDGGLELRLARIEAALTEILHELRARRRRGAKRTVSAAERVQDHVVNTLQFVPTEMQIARARKALGRARSSKR